MTKPLGDAAIVPALVTPSPQVIVAVKSRATANGLGSPKLATGPANGTPTTAVIGLGAPVSTASATCACEGVVAVAPAGAPDLSRWWMVTLTEKFRTREYVWPPRTWKPPGAACTVPGDCVPSPQSMLLVKSDAAARGFVSVKVATTTFVNGAPTTGAIVCGEGRMLPGSSPTAALIGTGTSPSRTDVNDAAYVPGSR